MADEVGPVYKARKGEFRGHPLAVFEAEVTYTKRGEVITKTDTLQFGKRKAESIIRNLKLVAEIAGMSMDEVITEVTLQMEG